MKNVITSERVWNAVRAMFPGREPIAIDQRGNWPKCAFQVWWDFKTHEMVMLSPEPKRKRGLSESGEATE